MPRTSAVSESNTNATKMGANLLPEVPLRAQLFPGGLEHRTAQLLRLVHQEGQQHQDHGQVLLAVAVVVLQVIPLILQSVF